MPADSLQLILGILNLFLAREYFEEQKYFSGMLTIMGILLIAKAILGHM
jgi:hypothetical protein